MLLWTGVLLVLAAAATVKAHPVNSPAVAVQYLMTYGYMVRQKSTDGSVNTGDDMTEALCNFQYMTGLNQTCTLDEATMEMMNRPRCGMPDVMGHNLDARRKRRYTLGRKWPRTDLTYRIINVTSDINQNDAIKTLEDALKVWSDVTPLTFTRVNTPSDIDISFNTRDHGDGNPFDGPSNTLAHAFFPEFGNAHFDDEEYWSLTGSRNQINLFQVAAHEFGHSLGLGHSTFPDALMAPVYRGYVPDFELHSDDIEGIQAQYGENSGAADPNMEPTGDLCSGLVDAVTTTADRSTYTFEGLNVWKFAPNTNTVSAGFPRSISSTFFGVTNGVDAAFYFPQNERTYIFKGDRYWRFLNENLDAGFPQLIRSTFTNLPNDIDAAFIYSGNGGLYFFKDDEYFRYAGNSVNLDIYPRPASVWNIPGNRRITAVMQGTNAQTYFFADDGEYYRFDHTTFSVASGYPRSTSTYWKGCGGAIISGDNSNPNNGVSGLVPNVIAAMAISVLVTISNC